MLTIKADKPLNPLTIEVLQEINQCAQALGVEVLLVGAMARDLLLENVYGLNSGRATRDVDFAFAVKNWGQFNQIKQYLISTGKFKQLANVEHSLCMKSDVLDNQLTVDLIPFGNIEDHNNMISWPPDMDVVMNLAGYQEALKSAVNVKINAALNIKVVSLAGLAILKIFAWSDRGNATNNKDAIDLLTLLRTYHEVDSSDRIYSDSEVVIALESFEYNPELTGAWLLGVDATSILHESTYRTMNRLLDSNKDNLVFQMAKSLAGREDAFNHAQTLLSSFMQGLKKK